MLLAWLFLLYTLLNLVWTLPTIANTFFRLTKKNLSVNLLLVTLFTLPIGIYFYTSNYYLALVYLVLLACLAVIVASISLTYQDFILLQGSVLLTLFAAFLFYFFPSGFNHRLDYEDRLLLFPYTSLVLLYLYRSDVKVGISRPSRRIVPWRFYGALLLGGLSAVFLLGEVLGWFYKTANTNQTNFFFYIAVLVLAFEIYAKVGIYKALLNCFGNLDYKVKITISAVFFGLFFAALFMSFAAFWLGLLLGLVTALFYEFGNLYYALAVHALAFGLSYFFFQVPL